MPALAPYLPPKSPDSKVTYEVARDYFKNSVYKGNATPFTDPWNDAMNEWTMGVEETWGKRYHDGYKELTFAQLTGAIKPETKAPEVVAPPADLPPILNLPPVTQEPLKPTLPPSVAPSVDTPVPVVTQPGPAPKADAPVTVTTPIPAGDGVTQNQDGTATIKAPEPIKAPPPVTDKLSEILMAGRDAKRKAQGKKGYMSTTLAGETGGFSGQGKTLLGGASGLNFLG